jgi:putative addiction module component (TIGR02574 family)
MATREEILKEMLALPAQERAEIIDALLSSLDEPDHAMDALWVREAEARLDAWDRGELKAIPLAEVLAKYGASSPSVDVY